MDKFSQEQGHIAYLSSRLIEFLGIESNEQRICEIIKAHAIENSIQY